MMVNIFVKMLKSLMSPPGESISLLTWTAIMYIYIAYKFIKLLFRIAERTMLSVVLIMASPLALACGVAQPTKGFLTGWVKLFIGNLIVQFLQVLIVVSIIIYRMKDDDLVSIFAFMVVYGLLKILEKLEDIVRDASMSVGIGRDMSSALGKIQSTVHMATQTTQVINAASKIFVGK